ncbi:MAG: sugar phosphate isomerase/epimerase family protein [Phycisphaerales bacterium]|jgi:sugar phosphate isomerase/epimerase
MPALATVAPFGFTFDVHRLLSAYAAVGVTTLQFYRNEQKPPTVAEALRLAGSLGLKYDSIHGVFGFHLDPSSDDPEHRKHCLKVYEDEGKLARDLGGPMVVVHPSKWNEGMRNMSLDELAREKVRRVPMLMDFLSRLAEVGQRLGVVYLIENQPYNNPLGHDPVALARCVLDAGSPHIRMCLDTGHAHITSDLISATRACLPAIAYYHIHDNDGTLDDHRMPGDGTIDWPAFAAVLREGESRAPTPPAPRMLEVFYDEPRVESLAAAGLRARLHAALAL